MKKKSNMRVLVITLFTLCIVGVGCGDVGRSKGDVVVSDTTSGASAITNFDECVAAGFAILKSNPRQCRTSDGTLFVDTRAANNETKVYPQHDDIHVFVQPDKTELFVVDHLLTFSGEARGTWFFEASFRAEVRDSTGTIVSVASVQGAGDWESEVFVPFTVSIKIPDTVVGRGTVVLIKNNRTSDSLPDDSYTVSVQF